MLGDAFERGSGEAVSAFLAEPRDPVLTFLDGLAGSGIDPVVLDALIDVRRGEIESVVGAPADTPMNQRSVLFNDLSEAPILSGMHWLLSDRSRVVDHLHEKGWRRRLTPGDVRR